MQFPRIDIDLAFAQCVEAVGGQVLDRILGSARSFKNADYFFESDQVVGELKVLSEDIGRKPDFIRATSELHARWVRDGKVKRLPPGRASISTNNLPPDCAKELLALLRGRLESSTIKQANKQIRDTKTHLCVPNAVGLLVLANDGNFAFKPDVLFHLLQHCLQKDRYRSIDALIFFTPNEPLSLPGFEQRGGHLWADLVVEGRRSLPNGFAEKLGAAWMQVHSKLIAETLFEFHLPNPTPEDLGPVDFVNKRGRRPRS